MLQFSMKLLLIFFVAVTIIECGHFISNNTNVINDVGIGLRYLLNEINCPLRITALVCWDLEFAISFYRTFNVNGHRTYQLGICQDQIENFPNDEEEHLQMIVVDLNCENIYNLINQSDVRLTRHYKWVVINTNSSELDNMDNKILELFKYSPILPRSEIYYGYENADREFIWKQVYRTAMSQPLILELFGIHKNNIFYDYRLHRTVVTRRRSLNRIELRASMVLTNNDSINHLDDYRDPHIDTITKVDYVLTNHLAEYTNSTVKYSVVDSWGYQNKDTGEWNGMIGELIQHKADLGASALFFTTDRVPVIQYIAMPSPTGSFFIFRAPKLSYTDNVFLLPFDDLVWLCLGALVLVTAFCLTAATKVECRIPLMEEDISDAGTLRPSIIDVFMLIFGATCQQGSAVSPRSITARVIMVVAFVILMFLYTSYSANIVALLQSPSKKIKTLNDLLNSRLKFGVDDTVFNHYYFSHATERVRKDIYEQKILNKDGTNNFMDLEKGVARMRVGLFAFHVEYGIGYKIIGETFFEDEKCGLQEIKYLQVIDPWYAIQKNSSYKELFKSGLLRMHEHGLQDRHNARLYTKKPKCSGGGGHFVTASLVDTGPAMLILLWGFGFALLVLFIEVVIHRYNRRKLKKLKTKFLN